MFRIFCISLMAVVPLLSACSSGEDSAVPASVEDVVVTKSGESWSEDRLVMGRQVYEKACADCHDSGKMEAPLIGNPRDWSGRSQLWEAVLYEHAKAGYMEMPAMSGEAALNEEAVEAAAEYMLNVTYPDKPRD